MYPGALPFKDRKFWKSEALCVVWRLLPMVPSGLHDGAHAFSGLLCQMHFMIRVNQRHLCAPAVFHEYGVDKKENSFFLTWIWRYKKCAMSQFKKSSIKIGRLSLPGFHSCAYIVLREVNNSPWHFSFLPSTYLAPTKRQTMSSEQSFKKVSDELMTTYKLFQPQLKYCL